MLHYDLRFPVVQDSGPVADAQVLLDGQLLAQPLALVLLRLLDHGQEVGVDLPQQALRTRLVPDCRLDIRRNVAEVNRPTVLP